LILKEKEIKQIVAEHKENFKKRHIEKELNKNIIDNENYIADNVKNDDKKSINTVIITITSTNGNNMSKSSYWSISRNEWKLYQCAIETFMKQYEQIKEEI